MESNLGNILPTESVGFSSLLIMIIWPKMAQLGLEESSEVEGFRRPKRAQVKGT